jgi:predicted ferric reductase
VDRFLAFLDQALHRLAGFAGRLTRVEALENLLEPTRVFLGLLEVVFEALLQRRIVRGFRHFWQRLDQLRFRAEQIAQLFEKEFMEGGDFAFAEMEYAHGGSFSHPFCIECANASSEGHAAGPFTSEIEGQKNISPGAPRPAFLGELQLFRARKTHSAQLTPFNC